MEFDFSKKFQKMPHPTIPSVTFLKLRFHDISTWHRILTNALGAEKVLSPLPHENVSQTKPYANEYLEWRKSFSLVEISTLWKLVFHPVFSKYHTFREFTDYVTQWCKISCVQHTNHVVVPVVTPSKSKPDEKDHRSQNIREFLKAQYMTTYVPMN
jgi:hypothetical protein